MTVNIDNSDIKKLVIKELWNDNQKKRDSTHNNDHTEADFNNHLFQIKNDEVVSEFNIEKNLHFGTKTRN